MALTKVRLPVVDVEQISNGNSNVDIATAGDDVVVTVGGTTIATFDSTGLDLSGFTLVVETVDTEDVTLTNGSVEAKIEAAATEGVVGTTSAHPLSLIANAMEGLSIGTDGKVTLGVEGTADGHLVTKEYVDDASGASGNTAELSSDGHISIPTATDPLIINWGTVSGDNSSLIPVTFDETFANAAFVAMAVRVSASTDLDRTVNVSSLTTTGMNIRNNSGSSTSVYWMAIGY